MYSDGSLKQEEALMCRDVSLEQEEYLICREVLWEQEGALMCLDIFRRGGSTNLQCDIIGTGIKIKIIYQEVSSEKEEKFRILTYFKTAKRP